MVTPNRLFAVSSLIAAGLLSACATTSESVITRAWQVDYTLGDLDHECRFHVISDKVTEEISSRVDADQIFEELWQACPDLEVAALTPGVGDAEQRQSGPSTTERAGLTNAGTEGNSSAASSEAANESESESNSDSESEAGSQAGSDSESSDGNSGSGESESNGNGRGSSANNGSGNGSEGSSPGRGKGANEDE